MWPFGFVSFPEHHVFGVHVVLGISTHSFSWLNNFPLSEQPTFLFIHQLMGIWVVSTFCDAK